MKLNEVAKKDKKDDLKCPKCGKVGSRRDKDGHVVAYGCFFCSPVRLPRKPHW